MVVGAGKPKKKTPERLATSLRKRSLQELGVLFSKTPIKQKTEGKKEEKSEAVLLQLAEEILDRIGPRLNPSQTGAWAWQKHRQLFAAPPPTKNEKN